jgi:sarcosine oxidase gamma subunit
MLKEQIPTWVRPDATDKMKRKLNEAANFFKHADRDHGEVHEFRPEQTELLLYDAIRKYRDLTGETVPTLAVYDVWFWLGPGAKFILDPERQRLREQLRQSYPNATRAFFFAKALPLVSSINT